MGFLTGEQFRSIYEGDDGDFAIAVPCDPTDVIEIDVSSLISVYRHDPPPLKWSDLRYVFDIQEDCNGKEAIQA